MRISVFVLGIFITYALLTGCENTEGVLGPKKEVSAFSEQRFEVTKPLDLTLDIDSGNIEIYSWDKEELSFEVTKRVRGPKDSTKLESGLKDFQIDSKQEGKKIYFKSKYKQKVKSPQDIRIDLKVMMPKRVNSIRLVLDVGTVKMYDDIQCDLDMKVNAANTEINRFEGKINLKGDMGNLTINNGRIKDGSDVTVNMGNISIKSAYEEGTNSAFKTGVGNIDLLVPSSSKISFEPIGTMEVNQLIPVRSATKVKMKSDMGKLSIKKY